MRLASISLALAGIGRARVGAFLVIGAVQFMNVDGARMILHEVGSLPDGLFLGQAVKDFRGAFATLLLEFPVVPSWVRS